MKNRPIVKIEETGYVDFFNELCKIRHLSGNAPTEIANKHHADLRSFVMDCANKIGDDYATFISNNQGLVFHFDKDLDKSLPLINLRITPMSKDIWEYYELYLNFDFWDIQDAASLQYDIYEYNLYHKNDTDCACPEWDNKYDSIIEKLHEGYEMFKDDLYPNCTFEDYCSDVATGLYEI